MEGKGIREGAGLLWAYYGQAPHRLEDFKELILWYPEKDSFDFSFFFNRLSENLPEEDRLEALLYTYKVVESDEKKNSLARKIISHIENSEQGVRLYQCFRIMENIQVESLLYMDALRYFGVIHAGNNPKNSAAMPVQQLA